MAESLITTIRLSTESQKHLRLLLAKTRLSRSGAIRFALECAALDITGDAASVARFYARLANESEAPAKE